MSGRRAWEFGYSPHLPPLEAWKEPERWINTRSGMPLPDRERIELPVLDESNIIDTDAAVQLVKKTLFVDDYDWSRGTGRLWGDVHHFYHPAFKYDDREDDAIAYDFRQTPTLMGRMPRTFHNAIHDFTLTPEMPSQEVMYDYRRSYLLAHQAFSSLVRLAQSTSDASRSFGVRRQTVSAGHITPKDPEDTIGQEILRDSFTRHFSRYSETVELLKSLQPEYHAIIDLPEYAFSRPQLIARKFGKRVVRQYINYLPEFQAA